MFYITYTNDKHSTITGCIFTCWFVSVCFSTTCDEFDQVKRDVFVYPEYSVEVLFVHSQEVAVVLSQDDGGGAGGVVHQGQFAEIISFV